MLRMASLRQSSPPYRIRDRGAASPAGAEDVMAGGTKTPSSVAAPSRVKARDMDQRRGYEDKKRKRQRHWILGSRMTEGEKQRGKNGNDKSGGNGYPCGSA